jgi:hypothetical protein
MSGRLRLPSRRPGITDRVTMQVSGSPAEYRAHVTVNFDPATGRPAEIFARATGRTTTFIDTLLDDIAVLISLALQHGASPEDLQKSMSRAPDPMTGRTLAQTFAAHLVDHVALVAAQHRRET